MRKIDKRLTPPAGLPRSARRWWLDVAGAYGMTGDEAGLRLLSEAAFALARLEECRAIIARDGAAVLDRFGAARAHPLLQAEHHARSSFLAAVRALNLDVEPAKAIGRPGAAY